MYLNEHTNQNNTYELFNLTFNVSNKPFTDAEYEQLLHTNTMNTMNTSKKPPLLINNITSIIILNA